MSTEICRVKKVRPPPLTRVPIPATLCSRAALGVQAHPDLQHKEVFRQAAMNWATSEDNPNKRVKKADEQQAAAGEAAGAELGDAARGPAAAV